MPKANNEKYVFATAFIPTFYTIHTLYYAICQFLRFVIYCTFETSKKVLINCRVNHHKAKDSPEFIHRIVIQVQSSLTFLISI